MGTIETIEKSIKGEKSWEEKAVDEMSRKKRGLKTDDEMVKDIMSEEESRRKLKEVYKEIMDVLKEYVDLREDYYPLIAVWIIGTWFHKDFESYPYLFINAMRGSGKTRLLKLIASMSRNGDLMASMSEAVLFRTASEKTFCLDEFEGVGRKEQSSLRELLNAAYKKGTKVKRMKKQGEDMVVEEFDVFCPIAIANIWGMEEVLNDRCIPLILEKSNLNRITKLLENFDHDDQILGIRAKMFALQNKTEDSLVSQCSLCSVVTFVKMQQEWNNYIKTKYKTEPQTTQTTHTIYIYNNNRTTQTTLRNTDFFNLIDQENISGRLLELFFPLFIISFMIGDTLPELIDIAKRIIKEKKTEEMVESRDVMVIDFISQLELLGFVPVRELTIQFKEFLQEGDEEIKWINSKWFGRCLKRLNIIKEKRRAAKGVEVIPDVSRAKKKIKMFKEIEDEVPVEKIK